MSFKPTYERLLEVTGATELAEAFRLRLRGEWGPRPGDDDWTWASAVLDAVDEGGRGDAARDDVRKAVLRLFDGTRRGASTGPEPALAAGLLARVDWSDELRLSLVADLQGLVKSIAADIAGWGGLRRHEEGVESTAVEVADALFALGGPDACGGVAVLLEAAARALPSPDLEEATAIGALASVCRLADSESGERADAVMRRLSEAEVPGGGGASPASAARFAMNMGGQAMARSKGLAWRAGRREHSSSNRVRRELRSVRRPDAFRALVPAVA